MFKKNAHNKEKGHSSKSSKDSFGSDSPDSYVSKLKSLDTYDDYITPNSFSPKEAANLFKRAGMTRSNFDPSGLNQLPGDAKVRIGKDSNTPVAYAEIPSADMATLDDGSRRQEEKRLRDMIGADTVTIYTKERITKMAKSIENGIKDMQRDMDSSKEIGWGHTDYTKHIERAKKELETLPKPGSIKIEWESTF